MNRPQSSAEKALRLVPRAVVTSRFVAIVLLCALRENTVQPPTVAS
jgi:hypothetical protein